MTTFRIATLVRLVDGWKETSQVRGLILTLAERAEEGKNLFAGAPLPEDLVGNRLPAGIASAWAFVIRPATRLPAHTHPNSVQHTAVLSGAGMSHIGRRSAILQPFDPAYPDRSIYVIPENTPHAFESFHEPLVVLSFHTVSAADLVEVDVETGDRRKYI